MKPLALRHQPTSLQAAAVTARPATTSAAERLAPPSVHQLMASRRVGGVGLIAMDLARATLNRGWNSVIWVPGPGPAADAVALRGLPHHVIGVQATETSRPHARLLACARLFAGLRGDNTIVHAHGGIMWGLLRPSVLAAGARAIVHLNLEPGNPEIHWILKRPPTHVVTCAHYMARQVAATAAASGVDVPVSAIPNSIDTVQFQPGDRLAARRRLGFGAPDTFVVLMLANLAEHKGQTTALRALERLRAMGVPAECWLAGEDREGGHYLRALRTLAADLGIAEHVRFLGFRTDGPTLLQAADAFVLPSTHEGLPLSLLEAQATRVPVIASDIPGVLEVVEDNRTGFIVPAANFDGYASRLADLARSPDLRSRLTTAGARYVAEEHSWQVFEQRMFELYQHMLSTPPAS